MSFDFLMGCGLAGMSLALLGQRVDLANDRF
jgi:hypothetical protein